MFYIPVTATVYKDGVCLFETDCEARIEYEIADGLPDWDISEFHFTDTKDGRRIYTKITRTEPLFLVLYDALNLTRLHERVIEALIDNGEVRRYA